MVGVSSECSYSADAVCNLPPHRAAPRVLDERAPQLRTPGAPVHFGLHSAHGAVDAPDVKQHGHKRENRSADERKAGDAGPAPSTRTSQRLPHRRGRYSASRRKQGAPRRRSAPHGET